MNGNKLLLDTNIILYILTGDETIARYLNGKILFASVISEIELRGFQKLTQKEEKAIKSFLSQFRIIYIDDAIKNEAILLRKQYALKLPDCIVAATAISLNLPLITADQQYKQIKTLQLELYQP
jgi:predicted nucleic acid-binding protein